MAHVAQIAQPIGGSSNGDVFYAAEDGHSDGLWQPEPAIEDEVHVPAYVQSFTGLKRKTDDIQGARQQPIQAASYFHPGQSVQFQQQPQTFRPPQPVLAHQPPLEQQQICQFFARGQCNHGANCRNLHLQPERHEQRVNVQMSVAEHQQYQMQQSQQQHQRQQAQQMKAQGTSGAMHPTGHYSNDAQRR